MTNIPRSAQPNDGKQLDHTAYVPQKKKKHNVQNVHVSVYTIQKQLKYIPGKHVTLRNSTSKKLALKGKMQKYFQHENTRQWNWKFLDKTLHNPFSSPQGRGPSVIDTSVGNNFVFPKFI